MLLCWLWLCLSVARAGPRAEAVAPVGAPQTRDGAHVVAGGWRAELREAGVVWAKQAFLGTIVAYAESGEGWIFVDSLGQVATSRSFLGPLRRQAQLPTRPAAVRVGDGVLLVQGLDAGWWISEAGALRPLVHPAGAVLSAAFLDPRRGAVMTQGGRVWLTEDGGARWTPVPKRSSPPLWLELSPDLVERHDGPTTELLLPATTPLRTLTEADRARLRAGLAQRALDAGDPLGPVRTADGAVWWLEEREASTVFVGREGETEGVKLPTPRCERLVPWGDRPVAVCGPVERAFVGTATAGGSAWQDLGQHAYFLPSTLRFDGYGGAAAYYGDCGGSKDATTFARRLCVSVDGGQSWRSLSTAGDYVHIEEIRAGRALVHERCGVPCTGRWAIVDLKTGEETLVRIPPELPDHTDLRRARVFGDTVVAVFELPVDAPSGEDGYSSVAQRGPRPERPSDASPTALVIGVGPPEALAMRPAPEGARFVDFLSAELGFAAGQDGAALWATQDGGRRWATLRLAVDGEPGAVPLARFAEDDAVDLRCAGQTCVLANGDRYNGDFQAFEPTALARRSPVTLVLHAGRPHRARVLAPVTPVAPRPSWDAEAAQGLPTLACAAGTPVASALPPPAAGALRHTAYGGGVEVAVDVVPDGDRGLATVRWTVDGVAHSGAPIPVNGPWLDPNQHPFSVLAATARGVLLHGRDAVASPAQLRGAAPRSPAWWWVLDGLEPNLVPGRRYANRGPAVADGEGGLWVTERTSASDWPEPTDQVELVALHFGAGGAATMESLRLGLVGSPYPFAAGFTGDPVLARPVGLDPLPLETRALGDGTMGLLGRPGALQVCAGPPHGASVSVPFVWPGARSAVWARLDVGPEAACVRGVEGSVPDPRRPGAEIEFSLRAEDGALVGVGTGGVPLRCTAATTP